MIYFLKDVHRTNEKRYKRVYSKPNPVPNSRLKQILDYNCESGNAFSRVLMEIFQARKVSLLFVVRDFLSGKVCLE